MSFQKIEKLFTLNLRDWTLRLSGLLASLKTKTTRKTTKSWLWNAKRSLQAIVRLSNITILSIRMTIKTKTSCDLISHSLSPTFWLIPWGISMKLVAFVSNMTSETTISTDWSFLLRVTSFSSIVSSMTLIALKRSSAIHIHSNRIQLLNLLNHIDSVTYASPFLFLQNQWTYLAKRGKRLN